MILHPAIIALSVGSVMVCLMVLYASLYGVKILRQWDLQSGSEAQLALEKKTYLVSTVMSYVFFYQLCSFFLFIFTADKTAPLFVGAMCAAGTLNVNGYGYPALLLKIINFILGGLWVIVNYTDNRAIDYPLIKQKYRLLLPIAPLLVLEMALQSAYFLKLSPQVITSCCGCTFSPEGSGLGAAFTIFPIVPIRASFYTVMVLTGLAGVAFYMRGSLATGVAFAPLSIGAFVIAIAALISFISVYFYQLPTHHCPFCILQKEYRYVGYVLYLSLLGGVVAGTAAGALIPARGINSLRAALPVIQRRLVIVTVLCYLTFTVIASVGMIFTEFKLEGY